MKPLTKRNTRFNVFDALVALVLVCALVALVLYLIPQSTAEDGKTAVITLTATGVRAEFLPLVSEGDLVYDQSGNTALGTITKITKKRDSLLLTDPKTGEEQEVLYPEDTFYALEVEIAAKDVNTQEEGTAASDSVISIGGIQITNGKSLTIRTPQAVLSGTAAFRVSENGGAA